MKEREVNLLDLGIEILLCWRRILLIMLIGGTLFGIFGFARSVFDEKLQNTEDKTNGVPSVIDEWRQNKNKNLETMLKEELTDGQLIDVNYAINYERLCRVQEEYQRESVLMQIDPNNTKRTEITFQVQSDNLEQSYNLEKVYEDMINSVDINEKLAEALNKPIYAVTDIWTLSRGSSEMIEGCDTFRVIAYHYDENICRLLAKTIIECINKKHDELEKTLGEHEIVVLNQSIGALKSDSILSEQTNFKENMLRYQTELKNYKSNFSDEQWYYFNLMTSGEVLGNPNKEEGLQESKVSLKYIILGGCIFALAYIIMLFVHYVLDDKLRITDQMEILYDIPQLGQIPNNEKIKHKFDFVDVKICALRCRNQYSITYGEAINLVSVVIKLTAKREMVTKICLIGSKLHEQAMNVCKQIAEILRDDLEIQILDNVLYNVETMMKLEDIEGAILVEKVASSTCPEIAEEIKLLERQQIKILGGIVVE